MSEFKKKEKVTSSCDSAQPLAFVIVDSKSIASNSIDPKFISSTYNDTEFYDEDSDMCDGNGYM